jgi:hypothetical protein
MSHSSTVTGESMYMLWPHDDYRHLSHTRNPLQLKESETASSIINEIASHGRAPASQGHPIINAICQ